MERLKTRVSEALTTPASSAHVLALCGLVALLTHGAALAHAELPVLRADSRTVDIRDGGRFLEGVWIIDPAVELDIYDAQRTTGGKTVTFITDVDSMSFDVRPGHTYDFVILLNGSESCRTRISTMTRGYTRVGRHSAGPDTIPITIAHGKLHVRGTVNASEMLDLIFDTGADICSLYPSAIAKGAKLQYDGTTNNVATGGTTVRRTSSDNRLEISGLRWDHEPVMYVEKQADRAADGIVGYTVFQDKVVEFDYDRMVMIVHDALPPHAAEYARVAMPNAGALTAVEVALVNGERRAKGIFVLDTAGTGAMFVNRAFAATHGLHGAMQVLDEGTTRGLGSAGIRSQLVLLPELTLAGFTLRDVPINIELPSDGNEAPPGGVLCMEVLMRFNAILDYRRNDAYFRPNTRFDARFKARDRGMPWPAIAGICVISVLLLAGSAVLLARRRRTTQGVPPEAEKLGS